MGSPKKLSQWALQPETWLESRVHWESAGIPLWVSWESEGCLLGVWFLESKEYFQQLCQLALQMGTSKKFSEWALQTETWLESAGSLLGIYWESAWSPLGVLCRHVSRSENLGGAVRIGPKSGGCMPPLPPPLWDMPALGVKPSGKCKIWKIALQAFLSLK